MPVEIERKFLVRSEGWRSGHPLGVRFCQGYLAREGTTVRIRRAGNRAWITVKGQKLGIVRPEFEYRIPVDHAEELLRMCHRPLIEKTRHYVPHAGHVWSVDVFAGANAGLVLAEIELGDPQQAFERPDWLGREVTYEPRFRNSALSVAPISDRLEAHHRAA